MGFLVQPLLRTADDVLLGVVSCGVRPLIDGEDAAVDGAVLAEEVRRHLPVVELLTVFSSVGMLRDAEVEHPAGVGAKLVEAGVEGVLQCEVPAAVALLRDDELLPLHDEPVG